MRIALAVAATVVLTGCEFGDMGPSDKFQTEFHYTYDLSPNGKVTAESFNGPIEITGWEQNKVEITGAKYGATEALRDSIKVDVHNTSDSVEIRASRPSSDSGFRGGSLGARMVMHVPRQALLGRIVTSNGGLKFQNLTSVDAKTSNGPIDAEQIDGSVTVKTSNSKIHVDGVNGPLEAETSNGPITIRSNSDASAKLVSSNSPIDVTFDKAPKGDIKAQTSNSPITLHLPAGIAAHIIADTSNSSISSDFDTASSGDGDGKKHLNATIGGGAGPTIELSTSNSPIHIMKGGGGN